MATDTVEIKRSNNIRTSAQQPHQNLPNERDQLEYMLATLKEQESLLESKLDMLQQTQVDLLEDNEKQSQLISNIDDMVEELEDAEEQEQLLMEGIMLHHDPTDPEFREAQNTIHQIDQEIDLLETEISKAGAEEKELEGVKEELEENELTMEEELEELEEVEQEILEVQEDLDVILSDDDL